MSLLKEKYEKEIVPKLMKKLNLTNPQAVPKVLKVVLNMGVGRAVDDKKELEEARADLEVIAGQKPVVTTAKKAVSAFKIRAGDQIGCKVTLRRERMYEFLDKIFNIVFPRMRDFQGLNPIAFDDSGNYSIGFSEQTAFPEIDATKVNKVRGLEIVIVTSAKNVKEGKELLEGLGCPLKKTE